MKPFLARSLAAAALVSLVAWAGSASAKSEKTAEPVHVRYAHTYAEAMAEAKERSCVILATFHEDG